MSCPVVGPQYCAPNPIELTVSKKTVSLSGDSYDITDPDGNIVFKMDGHAFSIRDKIVLKDSEGNPVLGARKKIISMHDRYEIFSGDRFDDESKLAYVRKAKLIHFKTHLDVVLTGNPDDDSPDYTIQGNFLEREAKILQGDSLVAEVKRKFSVGNILLDKHTFAVVICPGVDMAFIIALVIIMDAIHRD